MHGAGNDFIVLDNRAGAYKVDASWAVRLGDRRKGIGCDQLIVIEKSQKADVFMRIFNADGGEIQACGNASRCIAWHIMQEKKSTKATIETKAGLLTCESDNPYSIIVDMGAPKWEWQDIPLAESRNTLHLGLAEGLLMDPVAVNMGNPHAVFFVKDLDFIKLADWGAKLERNPLFPERANISAAQVIREDYIKLRVWERGAGETQACGTAACATLVAAVRRGLTGRKATIELPGGELFIDWKESAQGGHVLMTGPVAVVYAGSFDQGMLL